ncbi:MAG: GNAT family N-acetyltransferase [Verrucomicrobia bacterium]|nr:GNAT family N-acetyltransferase [Verrucomicrobiota bacterium]
MNIATMAATDWSAVAAIYAEGIATGHATFAVAPPGSFEDFADGKLMACAVVARDEGMEGGGVLGWAALTKVSDRCVYAGVAEVSVYVAEAARGRGVGAALMSGLIARADATGVWTLQAGIFPENTASLALHARHGFRVVGRRDRIGKMTHGPLAGRWRDTLLLERRSEVTGQE